MVDNIAVLAQSETTGRWHKVTPQPLRDFRTYAAAVEWLSPRLFDADFSRGPSPTSRYAVVLSSDVERFLDDPLDVTHVMVEVRIPS